MSENSAPGLTEVAGLIAPTNASPWLVALLRDWAPGITLDCGVHAIQPTKAKMRERLTKMAEAAAILQRGLNDSSTNEFLEVEHQAFGGSKRSIS